MTSELSPNSAFSTCVLIKVWRKESNLGEPLAILGVGGGAKSMLCLSQGVCGGCSIRLGTQETPTGWHPGCEMTGEGVGGNGPIPSTDLYGINLPCLVTPAGQSDRLDQEIRLFAIQTH